MTSAPVFKDSWSFTPSEEEQDLDSRLFWWKDSPWIMAKNQSWSFPFIQLLESLPLSWNLTTPFWQLTPLWNIPIVHSWWITKLSMKFAERISASQGMFLYLKVILILAPFQTNLYELKSVDCPDRVFDHSFSQIRRGPECGFDGVPD